MKALRLYETDGKPVLFEQEIPTPKPGSGEVLVRVHAVGVTPTELLWYPTTHEKDGSPRVHAVPGHEFSGEVTELGEGAATVFSRGQTVYGMNDWFAGGALAEYCLTRTDWLAPRPRYSSHEEAASVPISALTAWQGLLTRARIQAGERVLIHGGAGAVGLFAIQMAKAHGAHVITTASAANADFVKELGADEMIDYKNTAFENRVRDVDVVFDTVGGDTLQRSWKVLKPGGRMVTVAASSEAAGADERVKEAFFIVEPDGTQLREVGKLLDSKKLRAFVGATVPVSAATEAYVGKLEHRGHGKAVISTSDWRQSALASNRSS